MSFMDSYLWGVHVWIWVYLLISIIGFIGVAIYFFHERIRKKYYELRFPEKLLRVVVHYPSGMFRNYWRLVPDDRLFTLEGKQYHYLGKALRKGSELFAKKGKGEKIEVQVGNKSYDIIEMYGIKNRWQKYPEIHYFFNNPSPISWDFSKNKVDISGKQLEEFKENDLFKKLLTLSEEKTQLTMILIIVIINLLATAFIIAKMMGWIE